MRASSSSLALCSATPSKHHGAFAGPFQPGADRDQRRLAAARRADDGAGAALLDGERHIAQNVKGSLAALKNLAQMLYA